MRPKLLSSTFLSLFVTATSPLFAQGQYASSVAIAGDEVLVLKPRVAQGPATVYVYRMTAGGTWEVSARLRPPGDPSSGEAFSSSMVVDGGAVWVGGGVAGQQVRLGVCDPLVRGAGPGGWGNPVAPWPK